MEGVDAGITTPKGFKAIGAHIGIKKRKKDLSIIFSEIPAICSGVFTQNVVKAACIEINKEHIEKSGNNIQAIVINSGNANACTGIRGYNDAKRMIEVLANSLNISSLSCLNASTGVIGEFLPIEKIEDGIKENVKNLAKTREAGIKAAKAIMTTDTFYKESAVRVNINGKDVTIAGIAKGSGMIHPNMATMLGFITTDANIKKELLDRAFKSSIDNSFNMISVDGETSTNDMAIVLANGQAENNLIENQDSEEYKKFQEGLQYVCLNLAKQIVKDGEGASKFININIKNALSKECAKALCKSVMNSNLVKTSFFGSDANWGRILSAMGQVCPNCNLCKNNSFEQSQVTISFSSKVGDILLFEKGQALKFDEQKALKILKENEIDVNINLNNNRGYNITGYTCDLTYDYVKINASYRS